MEATEKLKAKAIGYYNGYSIKSNYDIELKFKFPLSSMGKSLTFVQLIGKPLKLVCKLHDTNYKLGIYNIYRYTIDRDGEASISFRSSKENVELENIIPLLEEEAQFTLLAMETESY